MNKSRARFGLAIVVLAATAAVAILKELETEGSIIAIVIAIAASVEIFVAIVNRIAESRQRRWFANLSLRVDPVEVSSADPYALGVTPSEVADKFRGKTSRPPYIPRDADGHLDDCLRHKPFVVIVGESKSGKSRTAFEGLARVAPDHLIVAPELPSLNAAAFTRLIESRLEEQLPGQLVVWLDDLNEFLATHTLTTRAVNRWLSMHPRVTIVGTIRSKELDALRRSNSLESGSVDVDRILDLATVVPLNAKLSSDEIGRAASAYPGEQFDEGAGAHFVAGQQLIERLIAGREACPRGVAVVEACIDCARGGMSGPIAQAVLEELGTTQLLEKGVNSGIELSDDWFDDAIRWATEPVSSGIGLLQRVRGEAGVGFRPFEYVRAYREGEVRDEIGFAPITEDTWKILLRNANGWTLHRIGIAAIVNSEWAVAESAFSAGTKEDDVHLTAHCYEDLAYVAESCGDRARALSLLEKVTGSKCSRIVATANYTLGRLLGRSDPPRAESAYRRSLTVKDSPVFAKAAVNLGLLLRANHNETARATEEETVFIGESEPNPREIVGVEQEATALFQLAIESDDAEAVGNGANALGVSYAMHGQIYKAEKAFRQGADLGHVTSKCNLIVHLLDRGDTVGAQDELTAIDFGLVDHDELALVHGVAGRTHRFSDRIDKAVWHYRAAVDLAVGAEKAYHQFGLARSLYEQDPQDPEINNLLQAVADASVEPWSANAKELLDEVPD